MAKVHFQVGFNISDFSFLSGVTSIRDVYKEDSNQSQNWAACLQILLVVPSLPRFWGIFPANLTKLLMGASW